MTIDPISKQLPVRESIATDTSLTSFRLSVLVPVYNERHVVEASLRRVLALRDDLISSLEVIVVDDQSTDGTWEILERVAAADDRVVLLRNERNLGKGAALRKAIERSTGDVSIVHDADLEYDPSDIPSLLVPFAKEGADAVFGSRYLSAPYRRALMHRHTTINKLLTSASNWLTDLNLSDLETCYKAVKTDLLKSIPLRSNDFRVEVELEHARRFNFWMGKTLRPFIGDRVLEIGAGIGTLTNQFIPRELYLASDTNPHYISYLQSYSFGKPYLHVLNVDVEKQEHFEGLERKFDTALIVNVLEHVTDEGLAMRNLWSALETGGRALFVVPQHPALYGTMDEALHYRERYTTAKLELALMEAGFRVEEIFDFNRFSAPLWWLNGKLLRRKRFSRIQLKMLDIVMPILSRIDRVWPWSGLSIIGVGVKD